MKYDVSTLNKMRNEQLRSSGLPDSAGALTPGANPDNAQDASMVAQNNYTAANALKQINQDNKRAENTQQLLQKKMARATTNNTSNADTEPEPVINEAKKESFGKKAYKLATLPIIMGSGVVGGLTGAGVGSVIGGSVGTVTGAMTGGATGAGVGMGAAKHLLWPEEWNKVEFGKKEMKKKKVK